MANKKLLIKIRSELLFQISERVLRNNEDRKAFNMGGKNRQRVRLSFSLESHLSLQCYQRLGLAVEKPLEVSNSNSFHRQTGVEIAWECTPSEIHFRGKRHLPVLPVPQDSGNTQGLCWCSGAELPQVEFQPLGRC